MKTKDGPGMGITKVLALVAVVEGAHAAPLATELATHRSNTPCFSEYRDWIYSGRTPQAFEVPEPFTAEQCAAARQVSERLDNDAATGERAANARRLQQDRENQAQLERQIAAAAERLRRTDAETKRWIAAYERERRELAKRPPATIGMTQDQALATRWGKPYRRSRVTTSAGSSETWHYERGALQFSNGRLTAIFEN